MNGFGSGAQNRASTLICVVNRLAGNTHLRYPDAGKRPMRQLAIVTSLVFPILLGCAGRSPLPTVDDLELDTVVLYRNGIGYFERHGKVSEDSLRLKVRKDQVNDLLKSLTVVDRNGQAVSVSMPLDPTSWANAAMATLAPGHGSLAQVLDSIRGTEITVHTHGGRSCAAAS
jgi:hypothetical protein